jgi:hypothetical protein
VWPTLLLQEFLEGLDAGQYEERQDAEGIA